MPFVNPTPKEPMAEVKVTVGVFTYEHDGKSHRLVINPRLPNDREQMNRTLSWLIRERIPVEVTYSERTMFVPITTHSMA